MPSFAEQIRRLELKVFGGMVAEWDDAGLGSPHSGRFDTTRWTMVQAVGVDAPESRDALEDLCSTYWYPLYAYLRRRGHQAVDAQDLTQAFVASLLERNARRTCRSRERTFPVVPARQPESFCVGREKTGTRRNAAVTARFFPSTSTLRKIDTVWSPWTKSRPRQSLNGAGR